MKIKFVDCEYGRAEYGIHYCDHPSNNPGSNAPGYCLLHADEGNCWLLDDNCPCCGAKLTMHYSEGKKGWIHLNGPRTVKEAMEHRYGCCWINEKGNPYNPDRCALEVGMAHDEGGQQCSRKPGYGPSGLYCKQHAKIFEGPNSP